MSGTLCHVLRVKNPKSLAEFYKYVMGMEAVVEGGGAVVRYQGEGSTMKLLQAEDDNQTYSHSKDDVYWKIGITVADVDLARRNILDKGHHVSEASQFLDIGYMCHLNDPEGFVIELLQHTFKQNFKKPVENPELPLGQPATIGQITLRCRDEVKSLEFYRDGLGMKVLSRQEVEPYGFVLYFLAFTEESPPHEDLDNVGNREWLWQRKYTTLELQHRPGKPTRGVEGGRMGFQEIEVKVEDVGKVKARLKVEGGDEHGCVVRDPEGVPVNVTSL